MANQKINWAQIFSLGIPYLIQAITELRNKKAQRGKYNLNLTDRQVTLLQEDYTNKNVIREDLNERDGIEYRLLIINIDSLRLDK